MNLFLYIRLAEDFFPDLVLQRYIAGSSGRLELGKKRRAPHSYLIQLSTLEGYYPRNGLDQEIQRFHSTALCFTWTNMHFLKGTFASD